MMLSEQAWDRIVLLAGVVFMIFMIAIIIFEFMPVVYADSEEGITKEYTIDDDRIVVDYQAKDILRYVGTRTQFTFTAHHFITMDDPVVLKTYRAIEPRMSGMSDIEKVNILHQFIWTNITYNTDDTMHGQHEYIQYPSETLLTGQGDCEDSALLLCTLLRLAGLDAVTIEQMGNHVFVGVAVDGTGEYVQVFGSPTKYYTIEQTSNWQLGHAHQGGHFMVVSHSDGAILHEICLLCSLMALISIHLYRKPTKSKSDVERTYQRVTEASE